MPGRLPTVIALALTAFLLAFGVSSSASASFMVLGQDPTGDAADPNPGRDIVKVGLSYNRRTGHLRGGVMLGGTPSSDAPANLTVFAGSRTATGCNGYPAIGFGTQTDLTGADWVLLKSAGAPPVAGSAKKVYEASAEEYEVTARPLAGKRPSCVIAQLNQPDDASIVYDVAGPYKLRALPELQVRLARVPSQMRPGRTRMVRLVLRNPGDAPTGRLRLSAARARGMKVRLPRRVGSLRAGFRRKVGVRVTLSARARAWTNLRVTVKSGKGLRATARGRLFLKKKRKQKPGKGGGSARGSKLCFRYTWLPPYSTLVPC